MTSNILMRSVLLTATATCLFAAPAASFAQDSHPRQEKTQTSSNSTKSGLNSYQLLYYMLLGEIAFARHDVDTALASYGELVKHSDDPRILSRANEIGLTSALMDVQSKPREAEAAIRSVLAHRKNLRARLIIQLPAVFAHINDKAEAAKIIERLTEPYLDLAESHMARATAEYAANQMEKAHHEAAAALKINPDLEQAVLMLTQTTPEEHSAEAMEQLGVFAGSHPHALESRLSYTRWLAHQQRKEEAKAHYQAMLKDFPDNDALVFAIVGIAAQVGDMAEAETLLGRLVDHEWGDVDRMRLLLGEVQFEQGHMDQAMQTLKAVRPGPQFSAAVVQQARILNERKQIQTAIQLLQQAAIDSPNDKTALQTTETILLRQAGRNDEAYKILQDILSREPDNQDILYDAAMLDEQAGRNEVMEQRLRRLIELKPDNAMALNALGYSFVDRNIRMDEAERLLNKAHELEPEDPAILDSVGWLYFRLGHLNDALGFLQRAYSRFPDPEVACHLIEVLATDGQAQAARKILQEAFQANPDNPKLKAVAKRLKL